MRKSVVIYILHNSFKGSARRIPGSARLISRTDDYLFPPAAALINDIEELRAEALPPLNVELLIFPELHG